MMGSSDLSADEELEEPVQGQFGMWASSRVQNSTFASHQCKWTLKSMSFTMS